MDGCKSLTAGLNFTPSPEETLDGARRRFLSPKARLVTFIGDDLDQNKELAEALRKRYEVTLGRAVQVVPRLSRLGFSARS